MKLFAYGNILVPHISPVPVVIERSAFVRGIVKIRTLEKELNKPFENGLYMYLVLLPDMNNSNIVPGIIVDVKDEHVNRLKEWEGKNYELKKIYPQDRYGNIVKDCYSFIEKPIDY